MARMRVERLPQKVIVGSCLGVRATHEGERRTGWWPGIGFVGLWI